MCVGRVYVLSRIGVGSLVVSSCTVKLPRWRAVCEQRTSQSPARCCVHGCCSTSAFPYDRRCSWASRDAQSPLSCRKARMCVCECVSPRETGCVCGVSMERVEQRPSGGSSAAASPRPGGRPWQIAGAALSSSPAALRAEDAPSARRATRRSARTSLVWVKHHFGRGAPLTPCRFLFQDIIS